MLLELNVYNISVSSRSLIPSLKHEKRNHLHCETINHHNGIRIILNFVILIVYILPASLAENRLMWI